MYCVSDSYHSYIITYLNTGTLTPPSSFMLMRLVPLPGKERIRLGVMFSSTIANSPQWMKLMCWHTEHAEKLKGLILITLEMSLTSLCLQVVQLFWSHQILNWRRNSPHGLEGLSQAQWFIVVLGVSALWGQSSSKSWCLVLSSLACHSWQPWSPQQGLRQWNQQCPKGLKRGLKGEGLCMEGGLCNSWFLHTLLWGASSHIVVLGLCLRHWWTSVSWCCCLMLVTRSWMQGWWPTTWRLGWKWKKVKMECTQRIMCAKLWALWWMRRMKLAKRWGIIILELERPCLTKI